MSNRVMDRGNGHNYDHGKDRGASREELARKISEISFYLDDIALYLDIHPCDETALNAKARQQKIENALEDEYQRRYAAIRMADADTCDYWSWIEEPWPWTYVEDNDEKSGKGGE